LSPARIRGVCRAHPSNACFFFSCFQSTDKAHRIFDTLLAKALNGR
jgi:hypothetical protein